MQFRAVIVAAVSSSAQASEDRYSLGEQLEACRAACEREGWPIVETITIPGHSRHYRHLHQLVRDCPEYGRMIDLVERGAANLVVAYRYDRLWRTDSLRVELENLCDEHDSQIYAVTQPLALRDPDDLDPDFARRWVSRLSSAIAEDEVATFRARSMAGKHGRVKSGLSLATTVAPYGYRKIDRKQPHQIDPIEGPWVKRIFEWYSSGLSVVDICQRLDAAGVSPRRGDHWATSTLCRMLHRPYYAGWVAFRRWKRGRVVSEHLYEGRHEPLIDRATFEMAQRLGRAKTRGAHIREGHPPHLLSGLLRCGHCGQAVCYSASNGYTYLRCNAYAQPKRYRRLCTHRNAHRADKIEQYALGQLKIVISDPDAYTEAITRQRDPSQVPNLQATLAELDRRRQRLVNALETGTLAVEVLSERLDRIEEDRARVVADLATIEREAEAQQARIEQLPGLVEVIHRLDSLDPGPQRRILRSLIRAITLRDDAAPAITWI